MSLRNGNSTLPTKFMASIDSYDDASIVMAGVPMDFTCSFRPGTRFGPQKIREVSIGIEEYSVYMDRDLTQCSFFDAGDLDLPFGDVDKSLKLIGTWQKRYSATINFRSLSVESILSAYR